MTEDGGEVDNLFLRNLGAYTRKVDKQISKDESDFKASTFWMTNPANVWKENVAAGSQVNGFWLELQSKVRGPTRDMPLSQGMNPKKSPLKGFISNVAHSNVEHGLRSYPFGKFIYDHYKLSY
jgi:cell migration-inducing and hyaluronan-binding protein